MATTKKIKRIEKGKCDAEAQEKAAARDRRTAVLVRFFPDVLAEIDIEARRQGLSRSSWVAMAARRELDKKQ
jgi:hypothetical protein